MKNKTILTLILVFILSISLTLAEDTYPSIGDEEADYLRGQAIFGQAGSDPTTTGIITLANTRMDTPIIEDLDGDNISEIIILDGNNLRIFEDVTLDIIDSFNIDSHNTIEGDERYSNIIAFDIDGNDSFIEIIVVQEKDNFLEIIEYNGTAIKTQNSIDLAGLSTHHEHSDKASEFTIKCESANKCIIFYTNSSQTGNNTKAVENDYYASYFNSTFVGNELVLVDLGQSTDRTFCQPKYRSVPVTDYDNDGKNEFITSALRIDRDVNADEQLHIFWVEVSSLGVLTLDNSHIETNIDNIWDTTVGVTLSARCDEASNSAFPTVISSALIPEALFTAPLTYNIDGSTSNGQETMVASMVDRDTNEFDYRIRSYNGCSGGASCAINEFDTYPEFLGIGCSVAIDNCATAHSLSNLYRLNADTEAGNDFCVSDYDYTRPEVNTICGGGTGGTNQQEILLNAVDVPFNITSGYRNMNYIWHSLQTTSTLTSGQNLHEVTTPFGVLRQDDATSLSPDWFILFANPQEEGIFIPVDAESQGSEDILIYSPTNLFYIDDGLSNQGARVNVSYNPCPINAILKINTTLQMDVVVTDQNPSPLSQDPVTARVSVYNDDGNELNDLPAEFNNVSSGTTLRYTFILNKSITNGEILIEGFDSENPDDKATISQTLNVQPNGLEFGDTECSDSTTPIVDAEEEAAAAEAAAEATLTQDADVNAITSGVTDLGALVGLAGTTIWLIFMIVITIGFWFEMATREFSGSSTLGAIAIFNTLMIILGARLGILSTGLVVIIVVISIVIIGIFLGNFLTGVKTGNNG